MIEDYRIKAHTASTHASLGIYPVWTGHVDTYPDYECKPRVLDDYFMIYVEAGSGYFRCLGKDYILKPNDLYFLFPGVLHHYKTHAKDLLNLWWIGFNGSNAAKLLKDLDATAQNPIIKGIGNTEILNLIKQIVNSSDYFVSDILKASGSLYTLIGMLMENCSVKIPSILQVNHEYSLPIIRALNFMNINYPQPITITHIASYAGLTRSHFSVLFKKETKVSPIKFLISLRLQNAKRLLSDMHLSITEIAHSVGFEDALYFSKVFTKHQGLPPSEYRRKFY